MNELALFAGAGGGILGGHLLGWRTVCAVEWEPYAASVLVARQNDGVLPPFPIWDDVCTFDGNPWQGIVDVVSGGFPCQDISVAGRGAGIEGERSGLWSEMSRIIGEVRPRFVLVENSPALTHRGGVRVIADLASMGYVCKWGVVGASDVGAPHKRERVWIVAHADSMRKPQPQGGKQDQRRRISDSGESLADANRLHEQGVFSGVTDSKKWAGPEHRPFGPCSNGRKWWHLEPDVGRVANGMAARVDRLKAIGNGQVPAVAATAFRILTGES